MRFFSTHIRRKSAVIFEYGNAMFPFRCKSYDTASTEVHSTALYCVVLCCVVSCWPQRDFTFTHLEHCAVSVVSSIMLKCIITLFFLLSSFFKCSMCFHNIFVITSLFSYSPRLLLFDFSTCSFVLRVMTASFHKFGEYFPGTGDVKDKVRKR